MLEFWEAGLQFLVYLAICELHLSPPALSEMGSRMIWKTKHYALCTMHNALWNTRALAYDLENCRNFAAIPTPSELGDPSVWERPTLLLPFPHLQRESLPNLTFWGNPKDIFSNSLLLLFPHLQSPLLSKCYFFEHFLPPKDNFPHVSRSRVSPNPTFWSTTICWYLLISPFFGSTQNIYSQPPPLFLFPQYFHT